jgi:hypothetical protein
MGSTGSFLTHCQKLVEALNEPDLGRCERIEKLNLPLYLGQVG